MIVCVQLHEVIQRQECTYGDNVTVFNCLDLKIKKNDVYQRNPVRCMLQFSIFPASATKIQKYLL